MNKKSFSVYFSNLNINALFSECMFQGDQGFPGEQGSTGERGFGEPGAKVPELISN